MSLAADALACFALVVFLVGVFCAYRAQEPGRNAWLWSVSGALPPPIAGIALLSKNAVRRARLAPSSEDPR